MMPADPSPLANHLWQSTLFTAAAWLLTLVLRQNRAAVRYGLWLTASLKFLIPFSLLTGAATHLATRTSPAIAPPPFSRAVEQISQPFALSPDLLPAVTGSGSWNQLPIVLGSIWLCGFSISAFVWFRWWRRFRAALRAATPLSLNLPIPVMTSPHSLEPGVFGIWKPIMLLPEGIGSRLSPEQLHPILAHELCHVQRRDNLTAAIHMIVESIFWFHPLVWWIGKRLVEERECACDEEVVRQGAEPNVYAEGILSVCRFYLQSPLPCASGVTGADLRKRIEAIVANRIAPRLTVARKMLLAASGVMAIGTPALIGLWHTPSARAQSQGKLVFEAASIKRFDPSSETGGRIPLAPGVLPGGVLHSSVPVFNLMCWAWRIDGSQLSGGPSWVRTDRYLIEAKPEKSSSPADPEEEATRTRERVKALLADRFHLIVRTETKDSDVYVLSVAKGGPRLTPISDAGGGVSLGAGVIQSPGSPVSFLTVALTQLLGRPVLDQTGLDGRFKYKMEFRPEAQPIADDDPRPSIFTAVRDQLGLELQSKKGPLLSVVIEKIERPTEN